MRREAAADPLVIGERHRRSQSEELLADGIVYVRSEVPDVAAAIVEMSDGESRNREAPFPFVHTHQRIPFDAQTPKCQVEPQQFPGAHDHDVALNGRIPRTGNAARGS